MNKKILDAAVVTVFCLGLFVMSDIEGSTKGSKDTEGYSLEQSAGKTDAKANLSTVTAGASRVLSEDSFTTESDELADIERNQRFFVTAPQIIFDEGSMGEKQTTVQHASGDEYNNRWGIILTEEEIELLARIVWLEANGEPVEGQEAVVEVVLNRMASELYPDTLYDVLCQKNPVQFCSWKNRDTAKPTEKEYESIRQVLSGNTQILREDTLYFSTTPLTENVDVRIGGHSFCY